MTRLHEMSALAHAELVRAGEVTSTELVEHYLARIEKYDPSIGAFVTVKVDGDGRGDSPLAGVPTAIKDNIGTAGTRTTFGSKAFENFVPKVDGHLVTLIRRAGLISLGKTDTPEFGLTAYGNARNPWDTELSAGGSSGGASAAVAAGLVPVAHGNDGGGSIRIPASVNGIFGLKTSRGRVSPGPLGIDLMGLTTQGALSRHVADAAALLDVMAVPMPGDPHWAPPLPPGESFLAAAQRDPGRLRIAAYCDTFVDVDPVCRTAWEQTVSLLEELGHEVVEIANPFPPVLVEIFTTLWAAQSLRFRVPDEELLKPITRWWREKGRTVDGGKLIDAMADAQLIARQILWDTREFDVTVTPTLAMPPVRPSWFTETGDPSVDVERQNRFTPFSGGANLTGQPSASLPLHWTPDGLPIGTMITGRPAGEAQLLSLCSQLERARPWSHRWPSL